MAIYRSANGHECIYDDDKLAFEAWVDSDPTRQARWQTAAAAHRVWQEANPDAHPADANDDANAIFDDWLEYANAQQAPAE